MRTQNRWDWSTVSNGPEGHVHRSRSWSQDRFRSRRGDPLGSFCFPVDPASLSAVIDCAADRVLGRSIPSFPRSPAPVFFLAVSRAPVIPVALTTGPFNLEEARRHGLTKDHLLGASWRRLGGGFYAIACHC